MTWQVLVVGSICSEGHLIENVGQLRIRGAGSYCLLCEKEAAASAARQYRKDHPRYARQQDLKKHGLTEEDYDLAFESQGGCCRICRKPPGLRRLSVDHDHQCCPGPRGCRKCFRGLLCGGCNRGIGQFKDDPELLRSAIQYLEDTKTSF